MRFNFQLLGAAHLGILGAVVALAATLAAVQRRLVPGCKWLRMGLASVLLMDVVLWYGYLGAQGALRFPYDLPLEMCDATLCLVIIVLFTLSPAVFDVAYYCALAGTSMALLTPDLWEQFPSLATCQFFFEHGLAVTATLYLVWSGLARPRAGSAWRAMLVVNLFAAAVGTFDWVFKTNFVYLRAKPENASLLDFLGPWPWYIATTECVALGLFFLLYLPFRKARSQG
jgi:hypothetical integral membrane protein (TIGR02206 family)